MHIGHVYMKEKYFGGHKKFAQDTNTFTKSERYKAVFDSEDLIRQQMDAISLI